MAGKQHDRRCKICDSLIPIARRRRHPCAVLCGVTACSIEHKRRRRNRSEKNWRQARGERDPEFRAKLAAQAGVRYQKRRMRQAVKKEQATQVTLAPQRAPQTNGHDSAVPTILVEAVERLMRA